MQLAQRPPSSPSPARWAMGTAVASTTVLAGICMGGTGVRDFVDLPSVVLIGGLVVGFQLVAFGARRSLQALALPFLRRGVTSEVIAHATAWWLAAGTAALMGGVVGTLLGLVAMLQNMSDPTAIGPAMAVALLSTFYAVLGAAGAFATALHIAHREPDTAIGEATALQAALTTALGLATLGGLDGMALLGLTATLT